MSLELILVVVILVQSLNTNSERCDVDFAQVAISFDAA
jgi:hypothetical protein